MRQLATSNKPWVPSKHTSIVLISSRDGFEYIADSFHYWESQWTAGGDVHRLVEAWLTQRRKDCEEPEPGFVIHILNDSDCASHSVQTSKDDRCRLGWDIVSVCFGITWDFRSATISAFATRYQDRSNLTSWSIPNMTRKMAQCVSVWLNVIECDWMWLREWKYRSFTFKTGVKKSVCSCYSIGDKLSRFIKGKTHRRCNNQSGAQPVTSVTT